MWNYVTIYFFCALGVGISVALPILRKYMPKNDEGAIDGEKGSEKFMRISRSYIALGGASLLISFIVFALLRDTLTDWAVALLAGYSWDSTLQKVGGKI